MTYRRLFFFAAGAVVLLSASACNTSRSDRSNQTATPATAGSATSPKATSPASSAATTGTPAAAGVYVSKVASVDATSAGGKQAPNFTWADAAGKEHSLKEYSGKVVMVNFWGTWCPPCRAELPDIVKIREELAPTGFEVIGVNVGERGSPGKTLSEHVAAFAERNNLKYPLMLANEDIINAFGGIEAVPTTFIVNGKGEIVSKMVGAQAEAVFRSEIKKAM